MNFALPRNNDLEILNYVWKVIDLPYISKNDLIFEISFKLHIFPPTKAINFINDCIEKKYLEKNDNQILRLSNPLNKKLKKWHIKRKYEILEKQRSSNKMSKLQNSFESDNSDNYNLFLKVFTDKSTINRAVSVPNSSFELIEFSASKGLIKLKVSGSKEELYIIEIDTKRKILNHNCHDFKTRRAENKKFCKHLVKLFLFLKDKDVASAEFFLREIAENIDKWEFTF